MNKRNFPRTAKPFPPGRTRHDIAQEVMAEVSLPTETLRALHKVFGRAADRSDHATGSVTPRLSWLTWQEECPTLDIAFKRCESIYNLRIPHVVTVKPEQSRKVTKGVRHFHIVVCINRSKA